MKRFLIVSALLTSAAAAQDLIHYKFDSTCTGEVINYAVGSAIGNGTIEAPSAPMGFSSRDPNGQFGGALTGGVNSGTSFYNRVKTGWVNPNVTGDFTMAFWMKERVDPGTGLAYFWSTAGSFRMFTNGIANNGLYQRNIVASGGVSGGIDLQLTTDVQTLAAAGWVHIALVIDAAAQTAVWYINGAPDTTINGVGGALMNPLGEIHIGNHSGTGGWPYDVDEFIVSSRAYSPTEILALSVSPQAGAGAYASETTSQCGSVTLGTAGGAPNLGNAGFQLTINTSTVGIYSVLLGSNRCSFAGGVFTLPLDAGTINPLAAGCNLLTDGDLGDIGGALGGSPVTIAVPIPNDPVLLGYPAFAQAAVLDLSSGSVAVQASNGIALGLGH